MKLTTLYEENLEGLGFKYVSNLPHKLDKAMENVATNVQDPLGDKLAKNTNNKAFQVKKNMRTPDALQGKIAGISLHNKSRLGTASPALKPKYRFKFGFKGSGLNAANQAY